VTDVGSGSGFDRWVRAVGDDPDPRFTLANERTFLSWMTTALGLLGIGLAVGTLLPGDAGVLRWLGATWVLLAVVVALRALVRWFVVERAMRTGSALPLSRSIPVVAVGLALLAAATAFTVAVSG
jgi:putative membrane protein